MKRFHPAVGLTVFLFAGVLVAGALSGCAGDPEPVPPPPAVPAPAVAPPIPEPAPPEAVLEPEPEPEPEPVPAGHAPLVGTRWLMDRLYGDMRALAPSGGPTWVEFREDGTVFVQGPRNSMEGAYTWRTDLASPRDAYNFEEGLLRGEGITRERQPGSYSEFEDVLLENLQLLKGYYIRGEMPLESTLTLWGGYRSEEVVLIELEAIPGD